MTTPSLVTFKDICLWCLILGLSLIALYFFLICVVSIWTGIEHLYQPGWWVPVLAGASFLTGVLVALLGAVRYLSSNIKQKGALLP